VRRRVLGIILAGGKGERLQPLTLYRSKPSVPFGGIYRLIDFVLSNFVHSGVKSVYVLTQFKSQSLNEHLHRAWAGTNLMPGNFIIPVPAQMQTPRENWYLGTADAVFQNLNLVRETKPDQVCVFGSDHIYFMDISQMMRAHIKTGAEVTIASIPRPKEEGPRFGVIESDATGRVAAFHEKSPEPPTIPGDPARCCVSMGNYVFSGKVLEEMLVEDAADRASSHDFGKDILPAMVKAGRAVYAYDFENNRIPGRPEDQRNTYWRDVGTLEAYYDANLDLKDPVPQLDLYNREWQVHTTGTNSAPAKFVTDGDGRTARATRTILASGSVLSGSEVIDSVLGRNVRVHSNALVESSILMDGVVIEAGCRVRRAILDKDAHIPRGVDVGYDRAADRARGWTVSDSGITVVPKNPLLRPITNLDL